MEEIAGERGIVVVVDLPVKGTVLADGSEQDALVALSGVLVGEDQLVLRPKGGVMILSLAEMRKESRFKVTFLDLDRRITVPQSMIENVQARVERLAELISVGSLENTTPSHAETVSVQDEALRAAEGPSGLPGIPEEVPVTN